MAGSLKIQIVRFLFDHNEGNVYSWSLTGGMTWEEIYRFVLDSEQESKDKQIFLNYIKNKAIEYKVTKDKKTSNEIGTIIKAFSI